MIIYLIAIAAVAATLLGGFFAIKFKDKLHLILGFSAGAVIGVAFFDLLPESIELSSVSFDISTITLFICGGFAFYLILDRFFSLHAHDSGCCDNPNHSDYLPATALIFHSFLDGIGIGLAYKISPAVGAIVAAAVLTHDFSDGINTVGIIMRNSKVQKGAIKWLIADALAPAIGILSTIFITVSEGSLGILLAVFTGFFLYIGASDLIPESHHRHPTAWTTLMTLLGIAVLYLVIKLAGL